MKTEGGPLELLDSGDSESEVGFCPVSKIGEKKRIEHGVATM
jgi:hypothetical protein